MPINKESKSQANSKGKAKDSNVKNLRDTDNRALAVAVDYLRRGWEPVPNRRGGKGAFEDGWQNRTVDESNVAAVFADHRLNVGVKLGPASNGLVDIDLDCEWARRLAPNFLPATNAVFGRDECPRSHWLYYSPIERRIDFKSKGGNGNNLLELRAGAGQQTVMPGSIYRKSQTRKSEGVVRWDEDGEPTTVDTETLDKAVHMLAAATLLTMNWPEGGRHDLCLPLAGAMARHEWGEDDTLRLIKTVAFAAGKPKRREIEDIVKPTFRKLERGEPISGIPKLKEHLEDTVVDRLADWLGLHGEKSPTGDAMSMDELMEVLADHYAVDVGGQLAVYRFRDNPETETRDVIRYTKEKFLGRWNERFAFNKAGKILAAGSAWLQTVAPEVYEGTVIEQTDERRVRGALNMWAGFGIEPREGDWSVMRRHLLEVVCDGDEALFEFVVKWSAWVVQNPTRRPGTALNLRGDEGTGKGIFLQFFVSVLGHHARQLQGESQMFSSFNGWVEGCLLVYLNEAMYGGKKDIGFLKALVTEDRLRVNEKFLPAWEVRNYATVISSSNAEWSAPLGDTDRRWIVIDVNGEKANDQDHFEALWKAIEDDGLYEAMLHDLLRMDLTGFNPRNIPSTSARDELRLRAMHPIDRWWFGCLCVGRMVSAFDDINEAKEWPARLKKAEIGASCQKWVSNFTRSPRRDISTSAVMRRLREYVPLNGVKKRKDGTEVPCHETSQPTGGEREWVVPPLDECRETWNQKRKMHIDWDDVADDVLTEAFGSIRF